MGITIGDVLTVVFTVLAFCISSWAMMVAGAHLFENRSIRARDALLGSPWISLLVGFLVTVFGGTLLVAVGAQPLPALKLMALLGYCAFALVAALGGSAIARVLADRMTRSDPHFSRVGALGRAAGLIVASCILPVVGWFVLAPIVLFFSIGCGLQALVSRREVGDSVA
ncbi:MAG: hypothetical protein AKCLJLPJ_00938 [Fimbriimonadales bacterium]|nr:hypothetical protein [Armatimonadota bacterium]MBV6502882.1 hypothetical protein [Fimbriimonadales bacterium]NOG93689.1 hypothetical protein [Armatimonadota bacterium]